MKTLPPGLAAALAGGVTTLCTCWVLTRRDGARLGFTDHDGDIVVDGVPCRAETGATATAIEQSAGLSVDGMELMGALTDDRLSEDDLARGLLDGAALRTWRVDWSSPEDRVLLFAGTLGEVSRGPSRFKAEVRSLAGALNQPRGRLYTRSCDAVLGDGRCRVETAAAAYRGAGTVARLVSGRTFGAAGLSAFASGWFAAGVLTWTGGRNAGAVQQVRAHRTGPTALLDLWEPAGASPALGDTFTVVAGCDKAFETCRTKFANAANFQGFPHLPAPDYPMTYAVPGADNDGGPAATGGDA